GSGGGMKGGVGGEIGGGGGGIVEDEVVAKPLGQPLSHEARQDVGRATSPKADDDANRPRRIGLRQGQTRSRRQGEGTSRQIQKASTGKRHKALPAQLATGT